MKIFTIIFLLFSTIISSGQYYEPVSSVFNQYPYLLNNTRYFYTDSINHKLYFIGEYRQPLDTFGVAVYEYDNIADTLTPLPLLPVDGADIPAMAIFNGRKYIGGGTNYTTNYMYWVYLLYLDSNGQNWDTVPEQPNSDVGCLLTWNNQLYVGGDFTKIGGIPYNNVAMYDGQNWHALAQGNCFYDESFIVSMVYYKGYLYATGVISDSCNSAINQLARWDGTEWEAVPGWSIGLNSTMYAMCVYNDVLYVAGYFFASDGVSLGNCIVGFDGQNWFSPGAGANNEINGLCVMGGKLYASGNFSWIDGITTNCIAAWDGHHWCSIDSAQVQVHSYTICGAVDDKLAIAGGFTYIGSKPIKEEAFWTGVNYTDSCGPLYTSIDNTLPPVNELKIYPDPTSDLLKIIPPDNTTASYSISVSNILGQTIYKTYPTNNQIDVSHLAPGIYLLKCDFNGLCQTAKFVKQ